MVLEQSWSRVTASNDGQLDSWRCSFLRTRRRARPGHPLANERHPVKDGGLVSGDRKLKESTPRLAPSRPQPPTIGFDNRAADREAHAHAVGLRRVEGFKEMRQALRAQPLAGIPNRDANAVRLTHGA